MKCLLKAGALLKPGDRFCSFLKAEKKTHQEVLVRLAILQDSLFPKGSLQERNLNFSEFYKEYGEELIQKLLGELQPLDHSFDVLVL